MEMRIEQVLVGPPHEGDAGEGLVLRTSRGDIPAIRHAAPETTRGVIWVCGARGGFGGPASGLYAELSEEFAGQGITSLRMDYRHPNNIQECALDLLAGVNFLRATGYGPAVVVGHSFGGAVVIAGAAFSDHVAGVVSLSPQTYGAQGAGMLSPTPLLVVHGKADTRLPFSCAVAIHDWAKEPRELVLYEGAEHRLDECRTELMDLLREWIPARLTAQ
ncbi:MAG: lysophospholipase [Chloroflexi bacterium]|nr:lysophospholipase [Chloroflexota bacterium]MYD49760.1 lysophospholipase [Chloroflexota bacterium]